MEGKHGFFGWGNVGGHFSLDWEVEREVHFIFREIVKYWRGKTLSKIEDEKTSQIVRISKC